jgi:hypothetical protein
VGLPVVSEGSCQHTEPALDCVLRSASENRRKEQKSERPLPHPSGSMSHTIYTPDMAHVTRSLMLLLPPNHPHVASVRRSLRSFFPRPVLDPCWPLPPIHAPRTEIRMVDFSMVRLGVAKNWPVPPRTPLSSLHLMIL